MRTLIRSWFRNVFRRSAVEQSLDDEVRACVEILAAEKVRSGMNPVEAKREALVAIGGVEVIKDRVRDARRGSTFEVALREFRYASRMQRRQPLLTGAVVLTLALGIGAPTSVFSLLDGFLFRPPASRDPDAFFRVTRVDHVAQGVATLSQYLTFRRETTSASELAAWSHLKVFEPFGRDDPARVTGLLVTCNYFRVFGVDRPVAGRLFDQTDCASASTIAIVSEALWRNRFAGDPSVVGTSVLYGGVPVTIVGVAAGPPTADDSFAVGLWFPYGAQPALKDLESLFLGRDMVSDTNTVPWLELGGLLRPGVSRQAATAEFRVLQMRQRSLGSSPASDVVLTDGSRWAGARADSLWQLFAMALALPALIMITACVNVAGLLLSRAVSRQREMAVRLALGTSKTALVRMLLIESVLVSGLAAVVSLVLVYGLPPVLVRFLDAGVWFGSADALRPDWRVFACLGACGGLAVVLSGLVPALEALNPRLADALHGRPSVVARGGATRTRRVFVGIQIAASVVPLVAAMTFSRAAARFADPGFKTAGVFVADTNDEQARRDPMTALADDLAAVPGVESVAYSTTLPLMFEGGKTIRIPGQSQDAYPLVEEISPHYFETLGIPILAGRAFDSRDAGVTTGLTPVVVSRQFARRFFGDENVLGKVIEPGDADSGGRREIIGIAADRVTGLSMTSESLNDGSMIYDPVATSASSGYLFVKARDNSRAMADRLRARLRDRTGFAMSVQTFEALLADKVVGARRGQVLLLTMGGVSLLLAIIAVVGTVSFEARQRKKEFAIRSTLGAGPWAIRRTVMSSGLRPVPVSLALGLFASWGVLTAAGSVRILPLGSVAGDSSAYLAISAVLLMTVLGTLAVVAYPAGRRDPLISLREE